MARDNFIHIFGTVSSLECFYHTQLASTSFGESLDLTTVFLYEVG